MDAEPTMPLDKWIASAAFLLAKTQFKPHEWPLKPKQWQNMLSWAESLTTDSDYYKDGYTPAQAVNDELSNA